MNIIYFLKNRKPIEILNCSFIGFLSLKLLTPFLSPFFIEHKIRPNSITLIMILTGVISGFLLMFPSLIIKGICFLLYFLWFGFDCSDGEVARFTKQCSDYGKVLDWYAHLLAHPLFVAAMWISFQQYYVIKNFELLTIVSFLLISSELTLRLLLTLRNFMPQTEGCKSIQSADTKDEHRTSLMQWIKTQITYFPNYVVFIPLFFVLDVCLNTFLLLDVFVVWGILYSLNVYRNLFSSINYMLKDSSKK